MCGIIGIYSSGKNLNLSSLADINLDTIRHRGPDAQGWHVDTDIIMGFRRLSIIDVSGGNQPLYNEDEKIVLMVNGEIYNHKGLRKNLNSHTFRTRSDGEVLLHLYEEKGLDFLDDVNGMYGFSLFDRNQDRLILGRDRTGQKPIYYSYQDGVLRWGSELKTFLIDRTPRINREAVSEYLRFGYIPAPLTMLEGIYKLPAASMLVAERGKRPYIKNYWSVTYDPEKVLDYQSLDLDDWSDRLLSALRRSVKTHLESEVPMGFLLSGGVDSSSVFSLGAMEMAPEPVTAFTIGFESSKVDETSAAAETARRYSAEHLVRRLPQRENMGLADVLRIVEEPISTDALLPTAKVFDAVSKEGITTILTGEGADEILAGYQKFSYACDWLDNDEASNWNKDNPLESYLAHEEFVFPGPEERAELIGDDVWDGRFESVEQDVKGLDPLSQMLAIENRMRLPDRINQRLDRISMAFSIEARSPFMDHELIEFCAGIPHQFRITAETDKMVLRNAMKSMLPGSVLNATKAPFRAPDTWFVNAPDIHELLSTESVSEAGMVKPDAVKKLLGSDLTIRANRERIYSLYVLHKWYYAFYKQPFTVLESSAFN